MFSNRPVSLLLSAACCLAAALACTPQSPEEKVAALRSYYKATLNGFVVQRPPEPVELAEPVEEAAPEEAAVGEPVVEVAVETEPVEQLQDVLLDIILQHDSPEKLPGITVDISMVDAQQNEKGHWQVWFDTSRIVKANLTQVPYVLEDVPYVEGDGFYVEVRHPVPEGERGAYREFEPPAAS